MKNAKIGRAIMDADVFISLNHFKGHETAGFGGAIKNIGMGCGSRAGKMEQHAQGKPEINENLCRGCKRCMRECANDGLVYDETTHKMHIDHNKCLGCGRCIGACNFDAIHAAFCMTDGSRVYVNQELLKPARQAFMEFLLQGGV